MSKNTKVIATVLMILLLVPIYAFNSVEPKAFAQSTTGTVYVTDQCCGGSITVQSSGINGGQQVVVSPGGEIGPYTVPTGTTFTVTANPTTGNSFRILTGEINGASCPISNGFATCSSSSPFTFTVNSGTTSITGSFQASQLPLGVSITPGSATVGPEQPVTFTANPTGGNGGYTYTWYWTQFNTVNQGTYNSGSSNTYQFSSSNSGSYGVYVITRDSSGNTAQSLESTVTISNNNQNPGNIQVLVYDQMTGKPIQGSSVSMTSAPSGQNLLSGITDSSGQFTFQNVISGSYQFRASAQDYLANTGSGNIQNSQTSEVTILLQSQSASSGGSGGSSGSAPTVGTATITPQATSLTLPAGQQMYIFGMGTGGAYPTSNLANQYASVTDASGNLAAAVSFGSSNTNSFSTGTAYHTIGGISVSGFSEMTPFYGNNNAMGAGSASAAFTVTAPNSLVVIVSIASSQTYMSLNGLSGLTTDSSSANSTPGIIPMIIAHTYLGAGSYSVSETSSSSPNGNPSNMADLIAVFVFTPGSSSSTIPPPTETGSTPVSLSLTGQVSGPINNLQMDVTSGTVTAGGTSYSVTDTGQYSNGADVVGDSPNGVLSAGFIHLTNNLNLGLASCYTQTGPNQLSLNFYNGRPATCGGTTAITQPLTGIFSCPFNATGTLTLSGSQATITASGTGNCNIPTGQTSTTTLITQTPSANLVGSYETQPAGNTIQFTATVTNTASNQQTPTGSINWTANNEAMDFVSNSCNLSGSGNSASCVVLFNAPAAPGLIDINATYNGDGSHKGSSGITSFTMVDTIPKLGSYYITDISGNPISSFVGFDQPYQIHIPVTNPNTIPYPYAIGVTQDSVTIPNGAILYNWQPPILGDIAGTLGVPSKWVANPQCQVEQSGQWVDLSSCIDDHQQQTILSGKTANFVFTFTNKWAWIPGWNWEYLLGTVVWNLFFGGIFAHASEVTQLIQTGLSGMTTILGSSVPGSTMPNEGFNFEIQNLLSAGSTSMGSGSVSETILTADNAPKIAAYIGSVSASFPAGFLTGIGIGGCATLLFCISAPAAFAAQTLIIIAQNAAYVGATDPSPDFTQIIQPVPVTLQNGTQFMNLPAIRSLPQNMTNMLQTLESIDEYENATAISETRYEGAKLAGNQTFENIQLQAASGYAKQRDILMTTLENQISSMSYLFPALNSTQMQEVSNQIAKNGLPTMEQQILTGVGLGSSIQVVTNGMLMISETNSTLPTLPTAIQTWGNIQANETSALKNSLLQIKTLGPALNIQSPNENSFYNYNVLDVKGTTQDSTGVQKVTVSVDNKSPTLATLTLGASENSTIAWTYTTPTLPDGPHVLIVNSTANDGLSSVVLDLVTIDTTPPTVSGTVDRSPNQNGWYNAPITVTWSGIDVISGIKSCDKQTTYAGPNTKSTILTGHCTDNAGNVGVGQVTISYDSTPPEAYIEFNSTTKKIILYGNDSISGITTNSIVPTSVFPVKWGNDDNKLDNDTDKGDAQLRTYDITDKAGNTLVLVDKVMANAHEEKVRILSLQYNNGKVISVLPNEEKFEWSTNKNTSIQEIHQHVMIGQGKDRQDVDAKYSLKDDNTVIHVKDPSKRDKEIKESGLVLLHIATSNGILNVNGY